MRGLGAMLVVLQLVAACAAPSGPVDEVALDPDEKVVDGEDELGELIDMSTVVDNAPASSLRSMDAPSKTVFGKDTRVAVKDTSMAPYASTVMVRSAFAADPDRYVACTGTMIAPDAVLTAAHCVFNAEKLGGLASYTLVSPGAYVDQKGQQRALPGVGTLRSTDYMIPLAYNDVNGFTDAIIPHDYAVIRLPRTVPSVGVRKLSALTQPVGTPISITAYHGDLCATQNRNGCSSDYPLYVSSDVIRNIFPGYFEHRIDTIPMSSGAGVSVGGDAGAIVGVMSAEDGLFNTAVRLTDAALTNIRRWANLRP